MWRIVMKVCLFVACVNVAGQLPALVFKTDADLVQASVVAQDPMFQSEVGLTLRATGGPATFSGIVISPQWILTAAHPFTLNGTPWYVAALTGQDLYHYDQGDIADAWYINPGWTAGNPLGVGVDLALVHLMQPLVGITPMPVYRGQDQRGTEMYMAGYGLSGTYATGEQAFDGIKRAGYSFGQYFGDDSPLVLGEDEWWILPADTYDAGNCMTTHGDTGLAYLAYLPQPGLQGDVLQVAGINCGYFGDPGLGCSAGIRTSLYTDWIDQTTGAQTPEPGTLALLGAGVVVLVIARWRRRGWQ